MKKIYSRFNLFLSSKDKTKKLLFLLILSALGLPNGLLSQASYTYNFTGASQSLALSGGTYSIQCWGANGGYTAGGKGGYSTGSITVTSPTTLHIYVGGVGMTQNVTGSSNALGGWNGGGAGSNYSSYGSSGGGGGGSDVRTTQNTTYANRIIVAGGGGGSGYYNGTPTTHTGGHGGGVTGGPGVGYSNNTYWAGTPGTQSAGGPGTTTGSEVVGSGSLGLGGTHSSPSAGSGYAGCGGGGGYYGGSAGGAVHSSGGGGSGYIGGVSSGITAQFGQTGFVTNPVTTGNGLVIIKELCSINLIASGSNSLGTTICSGQTLTLTTNAISNYLWSTGATANSLVVSPTSNTVYALTATSPSNCTTTQSISINVSSGLPVLSIANPSNNICLGKTVSLTATGALTYTWSNPGVVNGQTFAPTSTAVYTVNGQNGCGITISTTTVIVAPLAVSIAASSTLVCEGYNATLTAVSSVSNYTWTPGALPTASLIVVAPLANTLYTVSASDGTCSGTQTVLITTKTTPIITSAASSTNICEGEQVTLTATGAGTGGTYTWTPGGSGTQITQAPTTTTVFLVAGTNGVGCTAYSSKVVLVNPAPQLSVTAVANKTMICSGLSTTLNASGATGYSWVGGPATAANAVSPTAALTVYTVMGTNQTNTCVGTATIEVAVITPSVTLTSSLSTCAGTQVILTASGATSYTWNGFNTPGGSYYTTPLTTTNYTLSTLTKVNGVSCPQSYTAVVFVNPNPIVTVVPKRPGICKGETNTLTASGASSYAFGNLPGTASVVVISPTITQNYAITGTDGNGCKSTIYFSAKVSSCNGINETSLDRIFSVFPNPSSGEFVLSTEIDINVELFNELGQHLRSITLNEANNHQVKINDLAAGIYFIKAQNSEVKISQKIVITK